MPTTEAEAVVQTAAARAAERDAEVVAPASQQPVVEAASRQSPSVPRPQEAAVVPSSAQVEALEDRQQQSAPKRPEAAVALFSQQEAEVAQVA